jgi:hypothetical protein
MSAFVDLLGGFAAGINVTIVGHPFETIKVRLQTQVIILCVIFGRKLL